MKTRTEIAGIPVSWRDVVPGRLGLYVPREPDALLEETIARTPAGADERPPYYGTLWPAGEALARFVLGQALGGGALLDLGCGLGVVGLAAARNGARVTFVDREARSLALVRASAAAQGLVPAAFAPVDWRAPAPLGRFPRIVAADVLYEERDVVPVAAFLARHLAADGEAWIADPRRAPAERFPTALADAGLVLRSRSLLPYRPRDVRVDLYRVGPVAEVA